MAVLNPLADARRKPEEAIKGLDLSKALQETTADLPRTIDINIIENKDYVGTGLFNQQTSWFLIPRNVEITEDAALTYSISHSNILSPTSTVTILVNEQPIKSMNLLPESSEKGEHSLIIPRSLLKSGYNAIQFRFYTIQNITRPCHDLENPANWVVVHKDTNLKLTYITKSIDNLELFPDPYLKVEKFENRKTPLTIALPENPTREEKRTAAIMIQYFGFAEPFLYDRLRVVTGKVPKKLLEETSILAIGTLDRNPFRNDVNTKVPADVLGKMDEKKGLVFMMKSPGKEKHVITIITGSNQKTLEKTAEVMTYSSLVEKMRGSYAVIDTSEELPEVKTVADIANPEFKDLGYVTTKIAGTFESSVEFFYDLPPHWELLPGTSVFIDASYSPLLDPDQSIMTVLINDKPIQTFKLAGGGGRTRWKFQIPEEVLEAKDFMVTVRVYLDVGQNDCESRYYDRAWIIIHDNSYFNVPHYLTEERGFENFPASFYGEKGLEPLKVVIPDSPSQAEFDAAFNSIYMLSSLMPYNEEPKFDVLSASEVTEEMKETFNFILIGSLARNPLMKDINSSLPLPLNPETEQPSGTRLEILPQFLQNVAVVELAKTPWSKKKRSAMFIGAKTDELVELAALNLLDQTIAPQWDGNVVLINENNQWYSYGSGAYSKKSKKKRKGNASIFLWVSILIVLGVSLGILLYRKQKYGFRDPFKEP